MRHSYLFLLSAITIVSGATVLNAQRSTQTAFSMSSVLSSTSIAQADHELGSTLASLELTNSQLKELQAIKAQYQPLIQEQLSQSRLLEKQLLQQLADSSSDTELRAKFQQVAQSQQDLMQIRLENVLSLRSFLTPEQRQKLLKRITPKGDSTF